MESVIKIQWVLDGNNEPSKDLSNIALKTILEGVGSGGKEAQKAFDKLVKIKT